VKTSFYELNFSELQNIFLENQFSQKSASLLYNWYFKKNQRKNLEHQDLSKKAKDYIGEHFNFDLPEVDFIQQSADRTVKFLFKMQDGNKVESVLIPFQGKYTICLSSQVGCAMNCAFCFTGKQGYTRNLKPYEIVGQFMQAKTWLTENRPGDDRILNIVFMGQGEPLHNFDSVKKACEIFLSQHGLSLASHKITISTSGYLPGLKRWKAEMPDVNIALSLHSPITEKRNELIPINKKYPLSEVIDLAEQIPKEEKRFVTYEYLLIADFNDSEADALTTGELLKDKKAFINLIPFNPFPESKYQRPSPEKVVAFKRVLEKFNVLVTIRSTKGDQILAACGQLNTAATP
jgi:23S rRNA (adenine2503-C2)-methyltransferase